MDIRASPDDPLRLLPKVELHCHVEGTARSSTVAELAAKHGIQLGVEKPEDLYEYSSLSDFLAAFGTVCAAFVDRDDFHRMAYEAAEDAAAGGVVATFSSSIGINDDALLSRFRACKSSTPAPSSS